MKTIIIGAGPSGLITAREMLRRGHEVVIFEKSDQIGGMCRSWKEGEYILDTGPHIYHTPDEQLRDEWRKDFGDVLIEGEFWSKNVVDGNVNDLVSYPLSWEQINKFEPSLRKQIHSELSECDQSSSKGARNFKEYVETSNFRFVF